MFDVPGICCNMGSGFMISKNLVLTAAHNLVSHEYCPPIKSTNIRFFLAVNGEVDIRNDCYKV